MLSLGLDIGTTSISLAAIDESNNLVHSESFPHNAFINTPNSWEKIQDANKLMKLSIDAVDKLCQNYEISCIGVTGQQHGIVYLDAEGNVVSPLYTWQDARALQYVNGKTYLDEIKEKSSYSLSAGFGLATHYYNVKNNLVPPNAYKFATIADTVAMHLANRTSPLIEASNAHSFGMFSIESNGFDKAAMVACGIDSSMLPEVCNSKIIGSYHGIPISVAIGDNQASFIGATGGDDNVILVNFGTGSQVSLRTENKKEFSEMETRPYPLGGYLLAGSSLCGGRAWALTEKFFRDTIKAFTNIDCSAYEGLERLLDNTKVWGDYPSVSTCFDGTRKDPGKRGSIKNISINNFTPERFAIGILHGMAEELFEMYSCCLAEGLEPKSRLIGSGNGLRLNKHLRHVTEQTFGMKLNMSNCEEEASVGAAIFAKKL